MIGLDFKQWIQGDVIKIQTPTGSGKTTWVLGTLRQEAIKKKSNIFYLYNRRLLGRQLQIELGQEIGWEGEQEELFTIREFDGIKVCSYQCLQKILTRNKFFGLSDCCYVVLDEVHYFLRDSLFQPEIALLLNWLQFSMLRNSVTWILVSATIENTWGFLKSSISYLNILAQGQGGMQEIRAGVRKYFQGNTYHILGFKPHVLWEYTMAADYSEYDVYCFHQMESLIPLIGRVGSGKWLIFVSNKIQGRKIVSELQKALGGLLIQYLDSEEAREGSEVLQQIVSQRRFLGKVLVTTSVLDNGISLHDPELTNIVVSTVFYDDFIQMVGRKRKEVGERINLFVPIKSSKELAGEIYLKFEKNLQYMNYSEFEIRNAVIRDKDFFQYAQRFLYYDAQLGRFCLNPAGEYIVSQTISFLQALKIEIDKDPYAFVKLQLAWLGKAPVISPGYCVETWNWQGQMVQICYLLEETLGYSMNKDEQEIFSTRLAELANVPKKWKTFGLNRINNFLEQQNFPYRVVAKVVSRSTVWIVERRE